MFTFMVLVSVNCNNPVVGYYCCVCDMYSAEHIWNAELKQDRPDFKNKPNHVLSSEQISECLIQQNRTWRSQF